MSWKVRHEGSPQHIEGLDINQVMQGLIDGKWEPTDEVMGPQDQDWVSFEDHPQFAEVAAELEPPAPRVYDDQTHLDMNALIDVCLVLLIFFILTTTYVKLQKILPAPAVSKEEVEAGELLQLDDAKVRETLILVTVRMQNGQSQIKVEDQVIASVKLTDPDADEEERAKQRAEVNAQMREVQLALQRLRGGAEKLTLLIEHDDAVPHGVIVGIQDGAKSIGMPEVALAPLRKGA